MRSILLIAILSTGLSGFAQKARLADSSFKKIFSQVVASYAADFAGAKGELLVQDVQSADYECLLHLPGRETGSIAEYITEADTSYTWKNVLYTTDDFPEAKEEFRKIFTMVRSVNPVAGHSLLSLVATYKAPVENMQFTSIRFAITPAIEPYKNVVADLSIENKIVYWEISLQLYSTADEQRALQGR